MKTKAIGRHLKASTEIVAFALVSGIAATSSISTARAETAAKPWPDQCSVGDMPSVAVGVKGLAPPPASLIEEARSEGELVLYSALTEDSSMNAIVAAFQEAYPGVRVKWSAAGGLSQRRVRFLSEAETATQTADIITDVGKSFFSEAFAKKYLVSLDDIIPGFSRQWPKDLLWSSASGVTGAFTFSPFGFAYNTEEVPKELVPKTWEDLADPKYKGHIQIKDVNASQNTADHFEFLRQTLGDDKFKAFAANLTMLPLHTDAQSMAQELSAGGSWIMPQAQPNVIDAVAKNGAPVKSVVPDIVGGTEYSLGVAAKSPHPKAAALFAYWTYSPQGQWITACSLRSGSPLFPGYGPQQFKPYPAASEAARAKLSKMMGLSD